jgi:phospholipase/carboxylesterase
MASNTGDYAATLATCETDLLRFLRTSESIQEHIRLGDVRESQARMVQATGDTFRRFTSEFAAANPPAPLRDFDARFREAAAELEKSFNLFMTAPSPNWTLAFLYSRRAFTRGLYILYELRPHLPTLRSYFAIDGADAGADRPPANPDRAAVGFTHRERTSERSAYSLYVPENYTRDREWPLIICLHGGYGEGSEYIMTWLRPARTRGYILLSPKSLAETWSMTMNSIDTRSVMRMLDEVQRDYAIDRSRIYLTGLSDGGIFTYIMGIERHELFAGIAPVAGALHMAIDPMLRTNTGREVPIFVVHGAHDHIFPVTFTRQTNALLAELGYDIKYEELPEWGHAFPYSINERLLMPWFDNLPPRET